MGRSVGGQSDANIPFGQTVNLLKSLGFAERISGSHHIFTREGVGLDPGLSSSIAQAFESHGLDSAYSAAWSLRSVQPIRASALRSVLKAATTFGPIVVSPDYEDDAPFDYHPNLEWLLPETSTNSGGATEAEVEELWVKVVAFAQGIAVHHRTKVLLSVIGKDGRSFLVQAASTVVGGLILYWILHH